MYAFALKRNWAPFHSGVCNLEEHWHSNARTRPEGWSSPHSSKDTHGHHPHVRAVGRITRPWCPPPPGTVTCKEKPNPSTWTDHKTITSWENVCSMISHWWKANIGKTEENTVKDYVNYVMRRCSRTSRQVTQKPDERRHQKKRRHLVEGQEHLRILSLRRYTAHFIMF